jgi:hypothetical protein
MFRRYFSRVLFVFAAFVFVVLWAWAHGTSVDVLKPTDLIVEKDGSFIFFNSKHPYNVTCNHTVTAETLWTHHIPDWFIDSISGTKTFNPGTWSTTGAFRSGTYNPPPGNWTFYAFSDVEADMAADDDYNFTNFTWP